MGCVSAKWWNYHGGSVTKGATPSSLFDSQLWSSGLYIGLGPSLPLQVLIYWRQFHLAEALKTLLYFFP